MWCPPVKRLASVDEAAVDGLVHLVRGLVPQLDPLLQRARDHSREVVVEGGAPVVAQPVEHARRRLVHASGDLKMLEKISRTAFQIDTQVLPWLNDNGFAYQVPIAFVSPIIFNPVVARNSKEYISQMFGGWKEAGEDRHAEEELAVGLEWQSPRGHFEEGNSQRPKVCGVRGTVRLLPQTTRFTIRCDTVHNGRMLGVAR